MGILILKSPVGNSAERSSVWPPGWKNRNGFAIDYTLDNGTKMGFHTGVDLIRRDGGQAGKPVRAIADGIVKFADFIPVNISTTWGNLIVIYHGMAVDDDGQSKQLYSRYAHLQGVSVTRDKPVTSEDQIGTIGSGPPNSGMGAHLHFDISIGDALFKKAHEWPRLEGLVRTNYRNPEIWLGKQLTLTHDANGVAVNGDQQVASQELWVVNKPTKIRRELSMPDGDFPQGATFLLQNNPQEQVVDNGTWVQISDSDKIFGGCWVKKSNQDKSEIYISKK